MKAVVRSTYGDASVLSVAEVPVPEPGPGEVCVRVCSSSVNMGDRLVMAGAPWLLRLMTGLRGPRARGLGQDVAGVVTAVGAGVSAWSTGDRVVGEVAFGATWAGRAVAKADVLVRVPEALSLADLGSVPVAGVTAWLAVREHGAVQADQAVLVTGATGSVGSYALQLAVSAGATVTAVCSPKTMAQATALGAHHVVDYTATDYTATDARYDVIIDISGDRPVSACARLLTSHGRYVMVGGPFSTLWGVLRRHLALAWCRLTRPQTFSSFAAEPSPERLQAVLEAITAGDVRPVVDHVVDLDGLPAAIARVEQRQAFGKVVVRP